MVRPKILQYDLPEGWTRLGDTSYRHVSGRRVRSYKQLMLLHNKSEDQLLSDDKFEQPSTTFPRSPLHVECEIVALPLHANEYHELLVRSNVRAAKKVLQLQEWKLTSTYLVAKECTAGRAEFACSEHIDTNGFAIFSAPSDYMEALAQFAYDQKTLFGGWSLANWLALMNDPTTFVAPYIASDSVYALATFRLIQMHGTSEKVLEILTMQSANKLFYEDGHTLDDNDTVAMHLLQHTLVPLLLANGGGYVYAQCVKNGRGRKFWARTPMECNLTAHQIWFQLSMEAAPHSGCEPMCFRV